jgi:hypothetical protein
VRAIKGVVGFGAVALCALALTGSVPAGAINGFITPGHLESTGSFGFAGLFGNFGEFSAQIETGLLTFRPRHPNGPLITQPGNLVNLSVSTPQGLFGFGCWLVPASDVTVNSDLSASLRFNSADPRVTECPGSPMGTAVLGAPPAQAADGLVVNLVGRVQATVTWSTVTPILTRRSTSKTTCGPFAAIDEGTAQDVWSTTSGELIATIHGFSFFTGQFTYVPVDLQLQNGNGNIDVNSGHLNINGPSTGQCGQFGAP